MGISHMEPV